MRRLPLALLLAALALPARANDPAAAADTVFALPGLATKARLGDGKALEALKAWEGGPAQAAIVDNQIAPVTEANTVWDPEALMLTPRFRFQPILDRKPLIGPKMKDPQLKKLQRLVARGFGAGLAGVLYDNRDGRHSSLRAEDWPQLSFVVYGEGARRRGLDRGTNLAFRFAEPTIGNASLARQGPYWRSMIRGAMTTPLAMERIYRLYTANHLYVFPEHRDHDPKGRHVGDQLPGNQPFAILSQGSSGSDRPFLEAAFAILAAMPRDVRARLEKEGMLAPAIQRVFRMGLEGVETREDYMGPLAHPTAFPEARIRLDRMIAGAQAMRAGALPPYVRLSLVSQPPERQPQDAFAGSGGERLYVTPGAIAWVASGTAFTRTVTIGAGTSSDPNGRPLRYHWKLLRGDPAKVRIRPRDETGTLADIEVDWHDAFPIPGTPDILTSRVDIAVFADNGKTLSAPAFLSWSFPAFQAREWGEVAGQTRLLGVRHKAEAGAYVDPLLFPRRNWEDRFFWDETTGRLTGWTRHLRKKVERYTAHGLRAVEEDETGRPTVAEAVEYGVRPGNRFLTATVEATGKRFRIVYDGPDDPVGTPEPIEDTEASPGNARSPG